MKSYPGEGQVVFMDTPGIHRPLHRMNVRMVDAAIDTLREVDVLVPRRRRLRARRAAASASCSTLLERAAVPVVLA